LCNLIISPKSFREIQIRDEGRAELNMSTVLRSGNSYFQIIERYSILLRKVSFIHPIILKDLNPELEELINKIESLIVDVENSDSKTEKMFELRRLIFQMEDMVDLKAIQKYNQRLDNIVEPTVKVSTASALLSATVANVAEETKEEPTADGIKAPKDIWNSVTKYLKEQLNVHTYNVWVKPVEFHSCEDKKIKILVQNQFYKNWLEDHCYRLIKKHLDDIDSGYEVTFVTK